MHRAIAISHMLFGTASEITGPLARHLGVEACHPDVGHSHLMLALPVLSPVREALVPARVLAAVTVWEITGPHPWSARHAVLIRIHQPHREPSSGDGLGFRLGE